MEKNNNNKRKEMGTGAKVAMGVGIAAAAAAAAGAVYFYGTDAGKKKRGEVKGWMLKAKGEVLEKLETMKDWSKENYDAAVDQIAKRYKGIKNVSPAEIAALVSDLKSHWKTIKTQAEKGPAAHKSPKRNQPRKRKASAPSHE